MRFSQQLMTEHLVSPYCTLQVGCQSLEAELKPHIQPTLHSGCYESIEHLVVAQGKECDDQALSYAYTYTAAHVCEFKF